jgi:hypothetical protein
MKFLSCIDEALHRKTITGGFSTSGIYPVNPEIVTSNLPPTAPNHLQLKEKKRQIVEIGNKVVSDLDFLNEWEDLENKKEKEKIEETGKKRKRKKKKNLEGCNKNSLIEYDSESEENEMDKECM